MTKRTSEKPPATCIQRQEKALRGLDRIREAAKSDFASATQGRSRTN